VTPGKSCFKALLLDVDDTLCSTTKFVKRARENAVRSMVAAGLALPFEVVMSELDEVVCDFPSNYVGHYEALLTRLPSSALGSTNPAVIVASGIAAYHETKWKELRVRKGVFEVLAEIVKSFSSLIIGVVTSGVPVKQAEKLVRLGVLKYLEPRAVFFAEQMGFSKNNPKLYSEVSRILGVKPSQCVCVGDHPERDIDSPKLAGMHTVLIRGGGKYSDLAGKTEADWTITDIRDLPEILSNNFSG
jgi:putative hydrolase of the HAD superfamily